MLLHPSRQCRDRSGVESDQAPVHCGGAYHGYYQSTDGVIWTRISVQPGIRIDDAFVPTNPGATGSVACPIFRGALAVNPLSGDTFAWTVDAKNQNQGIWQNECAISGGSCSNQAVAFQKQWDASPLEANTALVRPQLQTATTT